MRSTLIALGVITAVGLVAVAQGELRPDFSGRWTLDVGATTAANGGGGAGAGVPAGIDEGGAKPVCGRDLTLVQTPDVLILERTLGDRSVSAAFKLNGSQTKHLIIGCRLLSKAIEREAGHVGAPTEMTAAATWSGSTLEIHTAVIGYTTKVNQSLTLGADKTLVVTTTISRPGETFRPVRAVYRRR
jgi:hypothetical protein